MAVLGGLDILVTTEVRLALQFARIVRTLAHAAKVAGLLLITDDTQAARQCESEKWWRPTPATSC